jgi:CBS domain containing-hemolysin-like protein
MLELLIAVFSAMGISFVCSLFEAVLYSAPMRTVEVLVQAGSRGGRIFRELRSNVDKPIAAILSLNTAANTAGAAIAGSAAGTLFGHDGLVYFSACFTAAILIFSEIIPKTMGVVHAAKLAPVIAGPLRMLTWVMTPVVWLAGRVTGLVAGKKKEDVITGVDIRAMARLGLKTGGISLYQEKTIANILCLDRKTAEDVMTPRTVVFSLEASLDLESALKTPRRWEHSRFPVYEGDPENIVGIVRTSELFMALAQDKVGLCLKDIMKPVHFVSEGARLNQVLKEFLDLRQHLFVVLDEYGGFSGIISLEDILEEILGQEILDESDQVADKRELARQRKRGKEAGGENGRPLASK